MNAIALRLEMGGVAVKVTRADGTFYYAVHGAPAVLSPLDVEMLFADSIAGDGGASTQPKSRCHFDDGTPR